MTMKNALKKYWPLYLLTIVIAFVLRYFSKITDSDAITWMLTPTVWWVSHLCGIPFEYIPQEGYLSRPLFEYFPEQGGAGCMYRFLVAPSCAGIRFLMILFVMLVFSFLHRIEKRKSGCLWFGFCCAASYFATILVNGVRIIASIYLPLLFGKLGITNGLFQGNSLHTLTGTVVYFSSLCLLYLLASSVCRKLSAVSGTKQTPVAERVSVAEQSSSAKRVSVTEQSSSAEQVSVTENTPASSRSPFVPAFWYLLTVLVLPFCKRILTNEWENFGSYTLMVLGTCIIIITLLCAMSRLRRRHTG